jgi:hypothetical protein
VRGIVLNFENARFARRILAQELTVVALLTLLALRSGRTRRTGRAGRPVTTIRSIRALSARGPISTRRTGRTRRPVPAVRAVRSRGTGSAVISVDARSAGSSHGSGWPGSSAAAVNNFTSCAQNRKQGHGQN